MISARDEVFAELSTGRWQWRADVLDIRSHPVFRKLMLSRPRHLKGKAAVLAAPGGNTYYHWMFDVLPRLEVIRQCGIPLDSIDHFILNGRVRGFQEATLKHFNLLQNSIGLDEFPHVKSDVLIAPSLLGVSGEPYPWVLKFLRQSFLPKSYGARQAPGKRIYISRSKAAHRRLLNESEALEVLACYRFQSVCLEDIPFSEAVALFQNAEMVVGVHGAGLTNIVFCKAGTKVIEIFTPGVQPQMYAWISRLLQLDYRSFCPEPGVSSRGNEKKRDVKVDLRQLEALLNDSVRNVQCVSDDCRQPRVSAPGCSASA